MAKSVTVDGVTYTLYSKDHGAYSEVMSTKGEKIRFTGTYIDHDPNGDNFPYDEAGDSIKAGNSQDRRDLRKVIAGIHKHLMEG